MPDGNEFFSPTFSSRWRNLTDEVEAVRAANPVATPFPDEFDVTLGGEPVPDRNLNTRQERRQNAFRFLSGQSVPEMTEEKAKEILGEEKKLSHFNREERDIVHKPQDDGDLITSKLDVSDIIPVI